MLKQIKCDTDIHEMYTDYFVDLDCITDSDTKNYLMKKYGVEEDENEITVSGEDIENWDLNIPFDAVDWNFPITERKEEVLDSFLKSAPAYVVMAYGCRWDGADGYTIVKTRDECFSRDYDAIIVPKEVSKGKKILVCKESSHDVPMGSLTAIIALNKSEMDFIGPYWKYNGERIGKIVNKFVFE